MRGEGDRPATGPLDGLWISWEKHRRTRELAREFGLELHEMTHSGHYLVRVFVLAWKTLRLLQQRRPAFLVVQNPSMVLAAWAGFLKPFLGYTLIVDRHSNFKFHTRRSRALKYRVFHAFSRYSLARADLTIVTNQPLVSHVNEAGGRGFVMPDRFPQLEHEGVVDLGPGHHILFICTFADDEPLEEVFASARELGPEVHFHVTGNASKGDKDQLALAPPNVRFTGFLPDADYQALLRSVDVVLALTTMPHCMQCGAYEAVSAGRPLVFGPDPAMVEYFYKGRVVTEIEPAALAAALKEALENRDRLAREAQEVFVERGQWWDANLEQFLDTAWKIKA